MSIIYDSDRRKWTLDRHIPVAVLMVIVLQTIGVIVWATTFEATTQQRLGVLERQMDRMSQVGDRLIRVEEISSHNTELLREIRAVLIQRAAAPK